MTTNTKDLMTEAYRLQQAGSLSSAENHYLSILKKQPDETALFLLGTLKLQQRKNSEACTLLKKSLILNPRNAMTHNNLGSALQEVGKVEEAVASYRKAIEIKPDYAAAHYNLGNAFQRLKQPDNAIESYALALRYKPDYVEAHYNLGNTLKEQRKLEEAKESYELAISFNPDFAMAHCNLGSILQELGNVYDAIDSYKRAIALNPDYAIAHCNLGAAFQELGNTDEAIAIYRKVLSFNPDYMMAYCNLGSALQRKGRVDEAILYYKKAIELNPDDVITHSNYGSALQETGKIDEAIKRYDRAIKLNPDEATAHLNKAFALLLTENFKEGWKEYEWRLQTKVYRVRKLHRPKWDGSPLNGKTILIQGEQGFGDTIQFVRYLPMVKSLGGQVIFECRQELLRLLKSCAGIDRIVENTPDKNQKIHFDLHIPLLSLPGLFKTGLQSIPSDIPYISVDPNLSEQWHNRLPHDGDFKIGIVWAGNPTFRNYHNRSCSLHDFAPLAEIKGVSFYSLQKGPASAEINNPPEKMKITDLKDKLHDFADTAAVINNLDLIISTDTAVGHLAGAMGKPVWILLHSIPDWRWWLERNYSPWYPQQEGRDGLSGMRLFRQTQLNDWSKVFEQVKKELMQTISNCELQIANCSPAHQTQRGGETISKFEIRNSKLKDMFQEALNLHQQGNLYAAENLYNNILDAQPDNIDSLTLLGTLHFQSGNYEKACALLKESVSLKPDNAMGHNNLGSALHASGKYEEAISSYRQAILHKPDYDEAYYNLGNMLQTIGLFEEAIASFKKAIALKPNDAFIYGNLANALRKNGKPEEALVNYKKATTLMPLNAELHNNLGAALQELGRLDEAIHCYRQAITLDAEFAPAHNNLGTALVKQHKLEEAMYSYMRATELKPDYAEAHNNLGNVLQTSGRLEEAIAAHEKAITLKPDYADAYYNLGNAQKKLNKPAAAAKSYKRAIELKPDYVKAHNNLGITLQEQGKVNEAAASFSYATGLNPDYADAHFNRSLILLLSGNFKEGWKEYEWRLRTKTYALRSFSKPRWDGADLNGRTILIHSEQGIGDTIQFVRYLPMVKARGGRVIFSCIPGLIHLLSKNAEISQIAELNSSDELTAQFDLHAPLLSLPGIFDTSLKSIPSDIPYIAADSALAEIWHERLECSNDYKIGIVWAGNPDNTRDRNRSCSLSCFGRLSGIPNATFYSLQKGPASVAINNPPEGMNIVNLSKDLNDFSDTAAVIHNLDLVISVDTAVAHLAGAMGKQVWTLLPFAPDWRWLLERSDSPWYPGMRLFRQTRLNDWDGVFEQVNRIFQNDNCFAQ